MNSEKLSKKLSYILRHNPDPLSMDSSGWVNIVELLAFLKISKEELNDVVENDTKKRFEYSDNNLKIRARQGHSIVVDLGYTPIKPPAILYHGSSSTLVDIILNEGVKKMKRHHVHMSPDIQTAKNVGSRKGKPVIFVIESLKMETDGYIFFRTENNVWLTEHIPAKYINKIIW